MSFGTAEAGARMWERSARSPLLRRAGEYFAPDRRRAIQTGLGLVWLLDGALQFQPFMYGRGFIDMLTQMLPGQPGWLQSSMSWAAHIAQGNLGLYNSLFAMTQVLIGVGILHRRTVRPALIASVAWTLVVWWFGEAFGMLFMGMANPLTGAPGAVLLYAIVGMLVWPNGRPGGLLGVMGARIAWASLWIGFGWLWLLGPNSGPDSTTAAINAAPSGMSWLSTAQNAAATAARGHGLVIAVALSLLSVAIGVAVAARWRPHAFLTVAVVLSLAYWVLGEGLGGIFTGSATDPNSGPLLVLLAFAVSPLVRRPSGGQPLSPGSPMNASVSA